LLRSCIPALYCTRSDIRAGVDQEWSLGFGHRVVSWWTGRWCTDAANDV
jgi:hypothetical protein